MAPGVVHEVDGFAIARNHPDDGSGVFLGPDLAPEPPSFLAPDDDGKLFALDARLAGPAVFAMVRSTAQGNAFARPFPLAPQGSRMRS